MQVILISGKAQHGKDTTANELRDILEERGESVLVTHYADLVKYICKQFFAWDGNKDEYGRSLLQYVGTDIVRKKRPNFWIDFIIDILKLFPDEWDYVIIPDARFPNEVNSMKDTFGAHHIRVFRPDFASPLSEEQQKHPSETALDYCVADLYLVNNGSVEDIRTKLTNWLEENFETKNLTTK